MKRHRLSAPPAALRPGTERQKPPRSLTGRLVILAAAAIICWSALAFGLQYVRTYALAREAARLERHRRDLLVQNGALLVEIRRLRTDDQYIEQLARQRLGMLRPGEIELVIVPAVPAKRHSERDPAPVPSARSADRREAVNEWLQRIMDRLRDAAEQIVTRVHPPAP